MAHRSIQTNFKLNPWSGVKGAASSIFRIDHVDSEILPIIEYMFSELLSAQYPMVKSELFTLVNIFNPDTRHSVGYAERPHADLVKPMTELVLTFQMMPRPFRPTPNAVSVNRFEDYTMLWGRSLSEITSCLVISVPKNIVRKLKLKTNHTDDLQYIYNVLGAVSKSFVQQPSFAEYSTFAYPEPSDSVDSIKAKHYATGLTTLLKNTSFDLWPYNRNIWLDAPNLIGDKHINPTFNLYYALHLHGVVDEDVSYAANNYVNGKGSNSFRGFIEIGMRDFVTQVRTNSMPSTNISNNLYAVLHLMYDTYEPGGFGGDDRNDLVQEMFVKLYLNFNVDDSAKARFFSTFSDVSTSSVRLIEKSDNFIETLQEFFL